MRSKFDNWFLAVSPSARQSRPPVAAKGRDTQLRCRDHAWSGAQAVHQFAVHLEAPFPGIVRALEGQVHLHHAGHAKARVNGQQFAQTAYKQQRASQQHKRERHLRHHQPAPQAEALASRAKAAAAGAHGCRRSQARGPQRRQEPEQQAGAQSDSGGETKHAGIQADSQKHAAPGRAEERHQAAAQRFGQQRAEDDPSTASSRLSAINCPTSRPLDAPMAWRTAISRSRTLARASSRLARLAQAINSTRPVVASKSQSGCS